MIDPAETPENAPVEELIADAVLVLEQRGEPGLQEFLARHATFAGEVRAGLERLRRLGVLAPPPAVPEEPRQYGEFRVLRRLAAGGMGVVYLAEQTSLKRQVALKVVRPELLMSETARERFQREVETVARLQHPGIVPILAVGTEGVVPWFAMEYVEGKSLEAMIESLRGKDLSRSANALRSAVDEAQTKASGASSVFTGSYWEACVRILLQVAQTMSYVHARGIVHRDLKPSNIVVTPQGQALVLDFGLAHVQDRQRVTRIDAPVGSPAYMAPEQLRGEAVDERVDVYALGVTLYQLLTGVLPFAAEAPERLQQLIFAGRPRPLRAANRAVPRDVEVVCAVAMDVERGRRYGSMADFAADLDAVLTRRPIRAHAPSWTLRFVRGCQRHPTLATIAAATVLLGLQFPLFLWQQEAAANAQLALVNRQLADAGRQQLATNDELARTNAQLREQRELAVASYQDALVAIDEMVVRTAQTDLATTPGSEPLRLGILQRALVLYDRLRQRHPGEPMLEVDAARTLQFFASLQQSMGWAEAAEARYHEVLARLDGASGDDAARVRGVTRKLLGQSFTYRGQHADAEGELRLAWCELQGVADRHADDRSMRRQVAEVINSLASVRRARGDATEELQLLQEAQRLKEQLWADDPDDLGSAISFALGCANLGSALERGRRQPEAEALFGRGIAALERLRPEGPEGSIYRSRLAGLYDQRGSMRQGLGDAERAQADHGRALALRFELANDFPSTASWANQAGASLHNLARVRQDLRDFAGALELANESIARQRQAIRMAPQQRMYRQHLEYALVGRCANLLELAQLDALPAAIDELVDGAVSTEGLLNAARLYVRCAQLVAAPGATATVEAADLRLRAVRAAEAAVARGFGDVAHFESGRWAKLYGTLRGIPAYEALLIKLRAGR